MNLIGYKPKPECAQDTAAVAANEMRNTRTTLNRFVIFPVVIDGTY